MKWLRIPENRAFCVVMLSITALMTLCKPERTFAQSACTGPLQSSTQTTSFTTGGNSTQSLSFTQYSPPANYALVAAVFTSTVTMSGSVTMQNAGSDISSLRLSLNDEDDWQIGGNDIYDNLGNDISDNSVTRNNVYSGPIADGQTVIYGPATPFNNTTIFYDSITAGEGALSYFQGTGGTGITYTNYPGATTSGGFPTITPDLTITNNITLTYYYCYVGVLATDILSFTAVKNGNQVDLAWIATDETPGRTYTVQLSYGNGTDFVLHRYKLITILNGEMRIETTRLNYR